MAFTTTKSIIAKVCSGDEVSWNDFYNTYRPLVWLRGSDYDLSESEQEDLLQQVMLEFFKQSKRFQYDPQKGRFRDYLRTIISHQALRIKSKRKKQDTLLDTYSTSHMNTDDQIGADWDNEWQVFVLNQALLELKKRLENTTYQAFDMYAIQGGAPKQVARFLDISVNNVYLAKNRAVKHLKEIISDMNAAEER